MSDVSQGPGWWMASDGKWYPPEAVPARPLDVDGVSDIETTSTKPDGSVDPLATAERLAAQLTAAAAQAAQTTGTSRNLTGMVAAAAVVVVLVVAAILAAVGGSTKGNSPTVVNDNAAKLLLKTAVVDADQVYIASNYSAGAVTVTGLHNIAPQFDWVPGDQASTSTASISLNAGAEEWAIAIRSASGTCFYAIQVQGNVDSIVHTDSLPSGVSYAKRSGGTCEAGDLPPKWGQALDSAPNN